MEHPDSKINVAIRGAGGLLGHRILRTIERTQGDMRVGSVVLGQDRESFDRFASVYRLSENEVRIFVDARRREISRLTDEWSSPWPLEPLDQSFGELMQADAIIDSAIVPGDDHLRDFYARYEKEKPIVFQSGTYPLHQPVAPPFEPPVSASRDYRQGDCLVSGIAPVIHALRDSIRTIGLTLLVQRQTRLQDYTLRDNLDDIIMNPNLEARVREEVGALLPSIEKEEISAMVFESPGHDYYACIFRMELKEAADQEEILSKLRQSPRVAIAPPSIPISTGQLQQGLREQLVESGTPLQPIVCFSCPGGIEVSGKKVTLRMAFYSKAITMLPNIDAVRGLVKGIPMIDAMKITDKQYGFRK